MICHKCGHNANKIKKEYKDGIKRYKCTKTGCQKTFKDTDDFNAVEEDIIRTTVDNENDQQKQHAKGKAGPKKVLNEFGRNIADTAATVLADSTQVASGVREKGFTFQEAQSITHPGGRILWRHLADTAKGMLPAIPGVEDEDLADVIEIAATVLKFAMRRFNIWYNDWRTRKLTKASPQVQKAVQHVEPPALEDFADENPPDPMAARQQAPVATASSNGHAAMVAMLPGDLGLVEG